MTMGETEFYLIGLEEQIPEDAFLALVKFRANHTCEECGETKFNCGRGGKKLHAHHIDGNPSNNCLANGKALCVSCHAKEHSLGISDRLTAEARSRGGKHRHSTKPAALVGENPS